VLNFCFCWLPFLNYRMRHIWIWIYHCNAYHSHKGTVYWHSWMIKEKQCYWLRMIRSSWEMLRFHLQATKKRQSRALNDGQSVASSYSSTCCCNLSSLTYRQRIVVWEVVAQRVASFFIVAIWRFGMKQIMELLHSILFYYMYNMCLKLGPFLILHPTIDTTNKFHKFC